MSLNVSVLMGRLVRDPELRHTSNGISVTSFTLAVDRDYCPKGQERQADFIDVVAWRKTAEFVCTYFSKGKMVAVQGPIQTRTYTDKYGNNRKAVEIVADKVHFAEPKRDTAPESNNRTYQTAEKTPDISGPSGPAQSGSDDFEEVGDISDDDLPF